MSPIDRKLDNISSYVLRVVSMHNIDIITVYLYISDGDTRINKYHISDVSQSCSWGVVQFYSKSIAALSFYTQDLLAVWRYYYLPITIIIVIRIVIVIIIASLATSIDTAF